MTADTASKPPRKERLKALFLEYGRVALTIYLVLFAAVFLGFFVAIAAGFESSGSATGALGIAAAAWVATKLTQPLRIGGTLLLTPLVGALLTRRGRRASDEPAPPDAAADEDDADDER